LELAVKLGGNNEILALAQIAVPSRSACARQRRQASRLEDQDGENLKAISLWAPWGSLMADARKKIETRSWRPPAWLIGQPVAIHQTMRVDKDACEDFGYDALTIPRGCIVAIGEFYKWEKFDELYKQRMTKRGDEEWRYGDFEMGRFGWFFTLKKKLNPPIAAKGHQQIWDWAESEI
jgi:hypothetical protein